MSENREPAQKLPTWEEFQNQLKVKAMKDENFRKELMNDPKAVVEREMSKLGVNQQLPATLEVKVIEQPFNALYIVMPATETGELPDDTLDQIVGGTNGLPEDFCLFGDYHNCMSAWLEHKPK